MGHSGEEKKDRRRARRTQTKRGQGPDQTAGQIQPLAQTQQLREYLDELEKKTILDNKHTEDFRAWLKELEKKPTGWIR